MLSNIINVRLVVVETCYLHLITCQSLINLTIDIPRVTALQNNFVLQGLLY